MPRETLHIGTSDAILYLWKKGGLLGTHLAWRDTLYEGPVPGGLKLRELSEVRTQYLRLSRAGNPIRIGRDFQQRDALIERAAGFDEIVLWFEHDLFDQLQLLQILEVFRELNVDLAAVAIMQSEHYLGMMAADELVALLPKRRNVTPAMAAEAAVAWQAFTGTEPPLLLEAARRRHAGLPFLGTALMRLCEEYPAVIGGLSRTQRQILDVCAGRALPGDEIFTRTQAHEEAPFHSEASIRRETSVLASGENPLLDAANDRYEATVYGRRILGGDADRYEAPVPERWIGGVRIDAVRPWRWDGAHQAFAAPEAVVET